MFWKRLLLAWTTLLALALAPASATARASVIAKTHVGVIDVAAALCIEAASSASLGEYRENPLAEYDGTSDVPHAARGVGAASAVRGGAQSAANAVRLAKNLASRELMSELTSGGGRIIAGAGARAPLRAAGRLAAEYGGKAANWVKVTSASRTVNGLKMEIHGYRNTATHQLVELKTKIFQ